MNISDFNNEYDMFTSARQKEGLTKLFKLIVDNHQNYHGLIDEILHQATIEEDDDGFGTEGANI